MEEQPNVLPDIRPASDLRINFTQIMNDVSQSNRPLFLTKKGRCDTVIMCAEIFSKHELKRDALHEQYYDSIKNPPDLLPNIRAAADLRTKFSKVIYEVYKSKHPIFLTSKGRCTAVILSAETYSKYVLSKKVRSDDYEKILVCSFCGNDRKNVKKLIAGPGVYICNACVEICVEIITDTEEEQDREIQKP